MRVEGLALDALLASGWGGETWSAVQDSQYVVVKRVDEDAQPFAVARLAREVTALNRLEGERVPHVLGTGRSQGWAYAVLEAIDGPDLGAGHVGGPITEGAIAATFLPVARTLAVAHDVGVVHRDLSPTNVISAADGGVLIDFGNCALDGVTLDGFTPTGWPVGAATTGFTPPEGPMAAGASRDVFALGKLLLWSLATHSPQGPRGGVEELAAWCCAEHPGDRPGAGAVVAALERVADGRPMVLQRGRLRQATTVPEARSTGVVDGDGGRGPELELLEEMAAGAQRAVELGSVLVLGGAGVGKSWLVERFARRAERSGYRLLRARCTREAGDLRALRGWLRERGGRGERNATVQRFAVLTGEVAAAGTALDIDEERIPVLVSDFLAAQAAVVAIIEDLHLAAPELLRMLERLPRHGAASGLVVATARPGTVQADDIDAATIVLRGLPDEAMRSILKAKLDGASLDAVITAADGNPMAAIELAGAGSTAAGASLTDLVEARIRRAEIPERGRLLAAAAGDVFWPEAVGGELVGTLGALMVGGLVRPRIASRLPGSTEFEWAHPLLREVAYEGFDDASRGAGHAEVAEGLAGWQDHDAEQVAFHGITALRFGENRVRPLAAEFAERAVGAAASRAAAPAAAAWLEVVREAGGRPSAGAREQVGDVAAQVGDLRLAVHAYADALLADRQEALDVARRSRRVAAVLAELGEVDRSWWWVGRAERTAEGIVARGASAGQREHAEIQLVIASVAFQRSEIAASDRAARAALDAALRIDDAMLSGRSFLQLEMNASVTGDPQQPAHAVAAIAALERAGATRALADLYTNLGVSDHDAGRFVDALRRYEQVLELTAVRSDALGRAIALNNMAETLTQMGRLDEADARLAEAAKSFEASRHRLGAAAVCAASARLSLWRGEVAASRRLLEEADRGYRAAGAQYYRADLHLRWCEFGLLTGDREVVQEHLEAASVLIDALGTVALLPLLLERCSAAVDHLDGRTGAGDARLAALGDRATLAGVPYEAAMARAWRACLLRRTEAPTEQARTSEARRATDELGIRLVPVPASAWR